MISPPTTKRSHHIIKNKYGINQEVEEQQEGDVVVKIEPSILPTNDNNALKSKQIKYCSLVLKLVGLLIIVGIVLLFALLPNYLRNNNAENYKTSTTDPTNAQLPGGGGSA